MTQARKRGLQWGGVGIGVTVLGAIAGWVLSTSSRVSALEVRAEERKDDIAEIRQNVADLHMLIVEGVQPPARSKRPPERKQ